MRRNFNITLNQVSDKEVHIVIKTEARPTEIQIAALLVSVADEILKKAAGIGERLADD